MIVRHTLFNVIGLGAPLLVAVVCIPPLIHGLGVDRFGLLTLIWAVVSYFGLFDLGLGRALTQQVSLALAAGQHARIGSLVGTATLLMGGLGVLAGIIMAALAPWGVGLINGIPDRGEAIAAVIAMAIAMPAIVLTSAFRGILEARHAFGIINLIRIPMGIFTFVGPLFVLQWLGPRLDLIAWVLVVGRIIGLLVHAYFAWKSLVDVGIIRFQFVFAQVRPLCSAGGWMTLTNVVSPFMGYVDRFLIGMLISPTAVAWYATPQEIVTKLSIVPGALTAVLFPTFAAGGMANLNRRLFWLATFWLGVVLLPVVVVVIVVAHKLLTWWIGDDFAAHSTIILQVFAIGMFINCLAHIPFTWLQGVGKSRLVALIHLIECPVFIILLLWLIMSYGIIGAVMAWLIRIFVDTIALFTVSMIAMNRHPVTNHASVRSV